MDKTGELIGKKVNLEVNEYERTVGNKVYKHFSYDLDDPVMEEAIMALGPKVRVFLPGVVGTTDYNMSRINVHINKDGIITEIKNG